MNLIHIWRNVDQIRIGLHNEDAPDGQTNNGRSGFIQLAIHILSIVPNSAATERLFSQFGIIHTKLRNRLSVEKVRKQALIRSDTITRHGFLRGAKRKFVEIDEDDASLQGSNSVPSVCSTATDIIFATPLRRSMSSAVVPSPSRSTSQSRSYPRLPSDSRAPPIGNLFTLVASELIHDLETEEDATPIPALPLTTTNSLLLKDLFHFPASGTSATMTRLHDFWTTCETGLHHEIVLHDTMHNQSLVSHPDDEGLSDSGEL